MTEYLTLTEFVPGTKAKAEDVNANFTVVKNAIGERALAAGDNSVTFSVAEGTDANHAVNKKQLDSVLAKTVNSMKFCCNAGATTNGTPSLLSLANNIITLTSNGALLTDNLGNNIVLANDLTLDVSGITGTVYLYYNSKDNVLFKTANKHVFAYSRPATPVEDTIYIYVNNNNWVAEIYKNSTWTALNGAVYLGYYVMANNTGSVTTNPYNQNGFDINMLSTIENKSQLAFSQILNIMPAYETGVICPSNTVNQAPCNGYVLFDGNSLVGNGVYGWGYMSKNATDWTCVACSFDGSSAWSNRNQNLVPIAKGYYFKGVTYNQIYFFKAKGEV